MTTLATLEAATPEPHLTSQQRNQQIVERYADGETLDSIGNSFGITRERVRQIVKQLGGTSAEASRQRRAEQQEQEHQRQIDKFLLQHGAAAKIMADRGVTREETVRRLQLLNPGVEEAFAHEALRRSGLVFDRSAEDRFSTAAMEAAIWYLIGAEHGLDPDPAFAAVNLDVAVMEELSETLLQGDATQDDVATVLGIIGAAKKFSESEPGLTITGARYNELRHELVETLGWVSAKGSAPWPPTRQTFAHRFGSWNEALESMGLATAERGRSRGLVKFTEQDYLDAMRMFLTHQQDSGQSASFAAYEKLAKELSGTDAEIPSGAAIRNHFGGWTDAKRRSADDGRPPGLTQ